SVGRIRSRLNAEPRYETESAIRATGADSSWTRNPPSAGPPTKDIARLPLMSEFPCTKPVDGTTQTNMVALLRSNRMEKQPIPNATRYSWVRLRCPNAYATGTEASSSARATSETIITYRRWRRRSTQTPAGSDRTRLAARPAAVSRPISIGVALSTRTASSGSASNVTWSPTYEIV